MYKFSTLPRGRTIIHSISITVVEFRFFPDVSDCSSSPPDLLERKDNLPLLKERRRLKSGRIFDMQAAVMPTHGSMQVQTLELTWLYVISGPARKSSIRATSRMMSKIRVLRLMSVTKLHYPWKRQKQQKNGNRKEEQTHRTPSIKIAVSRTLCARGIFRFQTTRNGMTRIMASVRIFGICRP